MNTFNKLRGINWCFTINNPIDEWRKELSAMENHNAFRYVVGQLEEGDQGTKHIQGYLQLNNSIKGSAVKKLSNRAHWEVAMGSSDHNITYCTKDKGRIDGPYHAGSPKQQGRRTDIETAVGRVTAGDIVADVIIDIPTALRYRNHLLGHASDMADRIDRPKHLIVEAHWGDSGTGKTTTIFNKGDVYKAKVAKNGWWWDNYKGQKRVLFDDFYGNMKFTEFLQLTDGNQQYWGDVKGITPMKIKADEYYFTSNSHPRTWYNFSKPHFNFEAFYRRFTLIMQYERKGNWALPPTKELLSRVDPDFTKEVVDPNTMCIQGSIITTLGSAGTPLLNVLSPTLNDGFLFAEDSLSDS